MGAEFWRGFLLGAVAWGSLVCGVGWGYHRGPRWLRGCLAEWLGRELPSPGLAESSTARPPGHPTPHAPGVDRIADYLKSLPTEQLAFEESERAREGAEGELVKLGDFLLDRYGPQAWQPGELVADVAIRLLRERDGP